MKFIITKNELKKGLSAVGRISSKNLVLPILNHVLISTEKTHLKLTTTNLEIATLYYCLAKIEEEGEITVPIRTFLDLVNLIETNNFEIETKGKNLFLSSQNCKAQVKGMDPKDFPIIPKIEKTNFVEINPLPLCEGIMQVIDFTSTNQARPELSGIYFLFSKNYLKIVATDSFRLAEKTLLFSQPQEAIEGKSFILPRGGARELVNLFSESEGKIKLFFSSGQVMFESYFEDALVPKIQLISRLIEGEFPDYQAIIPKEYKTQMMINKKEFLNGIKTASLFAGSGNEITILTEPKKGKVFLSAQNTEVGEVNIEIKALIKGERQKTCFNWKFLFEGISKIESDEIIFELNQEEGPGVIKPKDSQDFFYILMPIKPT